MVEDEVAVVDAEEDVVLVDDELELVEVEDGGTRTPTEL